MRLRRAGLRALALAAMLAGTAWSAPATPTQESDAVGVHVAVTPGALDAEGPFWEFAVSFRSDGPVLRDDMLCIASLVVDETVAAPIAWEEVAPPAAHHRAGVLRFVAPTWSPRVIEVRLRRRGESDPRAFRWDRSGWFALQLPARWVQFTTPTGNRCEADPEDLP